MTELTLTSEKVQITEKDLLIDAGLIAEAEELQVMGITNDTEWNACQKLCDKIKDQKKKVESFRKLKVGPFNEVVKSINDWFRPHTQKLTDLETKLGSMYTTYYRLKQEEAARLQREAEKKAEAERKKLEKKAIKEQETALFDDDPAQVPAPAPIPKYEPPKAAAPIQKIWRVRVINPDKVPTKYKVVSTDLLLADHKKGIEKIPGVEFYSEDILKRSFRR